MINYKRKIHLNKSSIILLMPSMDIDIKFSVFCRFVIGILCLSSVQSWDEAEVSGITNSNTGIVRTALQVHRMNKTTYAASGWVNVTEDFSDEYEVEMLVHYSRLGDNQYVMLPFHFTRSSFCTSIDGLYRRRFSKFIEQHSDLPKQVEGEPLCPLYVKGNYTITDCPIESVNKIFRTGMYKFEYVLLKSRSDDVVSRILMHVNVS